MDLQNNNAVSKNGTDKLITKNVAQNGTPKEAPATEKTTVENAKADNAIPAKPEPAQPQPEAKPQVESQPAKTKLTLDEKLKAVSELHRKSVQRVNLISRMNQIDAFEVTLAEQHDELEENPYQGCKLVIRDEKNREFVTTTPGLIRLVSQFIFNACNDKLKEIEASINFPTV